MHFSHNKSILVPKTTFAPRSRLVPRYPPPPTPPRLQLALLEVARGDWLAPSSVGLAEMGQGGARTDERSCCYCTLYCTLYSHTPPVGAVQREASLAAATLSCCLGLNASCGLLGRDGDCNLYLKHTPQPSIVRGEIEKGGRQQQKWGEEGGREGLAALASPGLVS